VARDVTESRERAQRLEEANVALKVLLRHREEDRRELEERFLANFRKLIMPSLEKLRKTGLTPRQAAYVDVVEMNVRKVFSASGAAAGLVQASLTPIETRIVAFIQEDKTNKEIGSLLNLSPRTVEYYRDRIRKKLGLKGKNVSLRSYLYSLSCPPLRNFFRSLYVFCPYCPRLPRRVTYPRRPVPGPWKGRDRDPARAGSAIAVRKPR
jgi:DNA-binding CsgD family transcriptional regulator